MSTMKFGLGSLALAGALFFSGEAGAVDCDSYDSSTVDCAVPESGACSSWDPYTIYTDYDNDSSPAYGFQSPTCCCSGAPAQQAGHLILATSDAPSYDCNDGAADVEPGNTELCDGRDNDCDESFDEGCQDLEYWCPDPDGDGYYNGSEFDTANTSTVCSYEDYSTVCGADHINYPGGTIASGCCIGVSTSASTGPETGVARLSSTEEIGWARLSGDCYDAWPINSSCVLPDGVDGRNVNVNRPEDCEDEADNDCSGDALWVDDLSQCSSQSGTRVSLDNDRDGYGSATTDDILCSCLAVAEGSGDCASQSDGDWCPNTDCNDQETEIHPNALEMFDGADTDCDGFVPIAELDCDGDSYLPTLDPFPAACTPPSGFDVACPELSGAGHTLVCQEAKIPSVAPATSVRVNLYQFQFQDDEAGNSVLDGTEGGPFRLSIRTSLNNDHQSLYRPLHGARSTDCDDLNAARNPEADEICDGLDNDCSPGLTNPDETDDDAIPDALQGGASRMWVHTDEADADNDGALRCLSTSSSGLTDEASMVEIEGRADALVPGDANDLCALIGPANAGESTDDLWCNGFDDILGGVEGEDADRVDGVNAGDEHLSCGPGRSATLDEAEESVYVLFYVGEDTPVPLLPPLPTCAGAQTEGCVLQTSCSDGARGEEQPACTNDPALVYAAEEVEASLGEALELAFAVADLSGVSFEEAALALCGVDSDGGVDEDGGDCTVLEVKLHLSEAEGLDYSLNFLKVHWPQARIQSARHLVSRWEAARYLGAYSSGSFLPGGAERPEAIGIANLTGGGSGRVKPAWHALFSGEFVTLRELGEDERWDARDYTPDVSSTEPNERLLAACWSDPDAPISADLPLDAVYGEVGGDCDPESAGAHRDAYEGWVEGWPDNNCQTCNDCIDNDCDGQTDLGTGEANTMDEGCLECLHRGVPMSSGCGGDRCARTGCGTSRAPEVSLALLVLLALGLRGRTRR